MIEFKGLTKSFGQTKALQGLTLTIPAGQVYGLIGPNGAGKTTAMSILATLLPADSGLVTVNGIDVTEKPQQVRRLIGYMPDFFGVYDGLTAAEYLGFFAAAYHIPENQQSRLIDDLLELVNLTDKKDVYVDSLSRGMKQRLALARCLVHNPKVLILDEPASGLDPRARAEMKEIIRQLKQMGKTVLISSHILPELAEICDQVGILEKGNLVASGPVAEITAGNESMRLINIEVKDRLSELLSFLAQYPGVARVENIDQKARLIFKADRDAQIVLLRKLIAEDFAVIQFAEMQGSLEDAFMAVTKGVKQ